MLSEVVFYVPESPLENVLPVLVEKVYAGQERCIIHVDTLEQCTKWNAKLWTYTTISFLPHASSAQNLPPHRVAMQPIFITHERRNENMAKFVFNLTSNLVEDANTYQRIVEFPEYWQSWLGDSQASHIQSRLDAYASICSVSGILWKQQAGEWVRSAYTPSVTAKRA